MKRRQSIVRHTEWTISRSSLNNLFDDTSLSDNSMLSPYAQSHEMTPGAKLNSNFDLSYHIKAETKWPPFRRRHL